MNIKGALFLGIFILPSFWNVAEGQGKPERYALKEVIEIKGVCDEDHVGQSDNYSGQVVRWLDTETGVISIYGSVNKEATAETFMREAEHPVDYHTPFVISFDQIDLDTSQTKWVLHGVSDRGKTEDGFNQGYKSTCNASVVSRSTKLSK